MPYYSPWLSARNGTFFHPFSLPFFLYPPPRSLRELLTTMGDRFTDAEVDQMLRGAPLDSAGNFDYVAFTRILKHGTKDE